MEKGKSADGRQKNIGDKGVSPSNGGIYLGIKRTLGIPLDHEYGRETQKTSAGTDAVYGGRCD